MNRREFLVSSAMTGVGLATAGLVPEAVADGPEVIVAQGPSPAALARAAVVALGGMGRFVSKGHTVVVKPNIGWDRTPEQAANTHPEVVRAVVEMCLEVGVAKVKVFDRTCNDPRRCYVNSGIGAALEALDDRRVEVSHVDERRFRVMDIPQALAFPKWPIYEDALSADRFINVPIAKHHAASLLTLAMKNIMGVAGGNRGTLHSALPQALLDLNRIVPSHLTLIDATRILTAHGPAGGALEDVKKIDTIVAGTDIVAVDAVACTLFGKKPYEIPFLKLAHEKGFGMGDLDRIRIRKVSA